MTTTTHAEMTPTVWASDTKDAIEYEEVVAKLVDRHYEAQLKVGRTLSIPLRANYNTQTKTEGVSNTITFQSVPGTAANNQDVTVSTQEYAAALLGSVLEAQSKYGERQRIAHGLGYALMRGVEISLTNLFQSFSQIQGSLGADPDDAVLRRSWQYLRDAGVTSGAAWVWSPAAAAALFGNDKFTSRDFISKKSAVESAELPPLYSYPSYVSNLLRAPAAGQSECALIHKESIILLKQVEPSVREQWLIRNLADGVVAWDLYAAVEAVWVAEAPAGDNDPTQGDYGAVLIRSIG